MPSRGRLWPLCGQRLEPSLSAPERSKRLVTELGLTFTFTLILAQPPSFRAKRLTKKAKSINHESLHGRIRLL